jgi:hypothetical protein
MHGPDDYSRFEIFWGRSESVDFWAQKKHLRINNVIASSTVAMDDTCRILLNASDFRETSRKCLD